MYENCLRSPTVRTNPNKEANGRHGDAAIITEALPQFDCLVAQKAAFESRIQEFEGMTRDIVTLDELLSTRKRLIADIQSRFDESTKRFLLSLHDGTPDFDAVDRLWAAGLPAVRWKLINLEKLKNENAAKHAAQRRELEALLS